MHPSKQQQKSLVMHLTVFALWLGILSLFIRRFADAVALHPTWRDGAITGTVVSWILLTSFYACFHLVSFVFSLGVRMWSREVARNFATIPPVAILYPCMNDFREKSVETCLAQDYADYAVYVLDDSTLPTEQRRVEAFCRQHRDKVSLIRRADRTGFKAGNLNNAIRQIGDAYTYLCVIDADERLPPSFLREMVAIAEGNLHLGFIQASHRQYAETSYGKKTGHGVDLHWDYFLPARNHYGFTYTYGHGVLVRQQAVTAIGGFPEVISEDIALSTKLREAGYYGYFASDIKSFEETPSSYRAFRRRTQKVTSGTLQFLAGYSRSFLQSSDVTFVEKIDMLIVTSLLYLPAAFLGFIVVLHCEILLLGGGGSVTPFSGLFRPYAQATVEVLSPLRGWDFAGLVLFTLFAPLCYLIPNAIRAPRKVLMYIFRAAGIHVSLSVRTSLVILRWMLNREARALPTGDRSVCNRSNSIAEYGEMALGLASILIGCWMGSLCLVAIGLALGAVPALSQNNLDRRTTALVIALPLLLTLVAVLGAPGIAVGAMGMFAGMGIAHA